MANLTATVDTMPDNDRFLPRYLTVQLLQILAKALPTKPNDSKKRSATAQNFIDAHKSQELFNALTYSIFWREFKPEMLLKHKNIIDELDQFGRSALTVALSNEDFELANQLIKSGAIVFLEDKIVLEIALISIIQRDSEALNKIMAQAPEDSDWAKEYLEYLKGYAIGKPENTPKRYREVLNPLIRHFGQVLDTMVYFNGTPSHYGFISPSLNVLSNHLNQYVKEVKAPQDQELFKKLAAGFEFTQSVCKFHCNLADEAAAATITDAILANIKNNNSEVVLIFGGWAGNSVVIAFINKYLVLSNLGMGGNPQSGTTVYNIKNTDKINSTAIATFMQGMGKASDPSDILAVIAEFIDPNPLITINQFLTPIDNCIFVNPRAIIQGILLVLAAYQKDYKVTAENLAALNPAVANLYQAYVNALYQHSTEDLAAFMRNHLLLQNRRIECCSLAIEYINQHYIDSEAMPRCIELKNALEFVGLRDYYNQNIMPEAKQAIQKVIISEQEAIALKVIEQEGELQEKLQ